MSKSTLAAEVDALQGNAAFISEFLDVPIFDIRPRVETEEEKKTVSDLPKESAKTALVSLVETSKTEKVEILAPTAVPKVVMPKMAEVQLIKRNYAGKYVIWTPEKPAPEERILIKKIIEAVGISAANLVLENDTNPEAADWSSSAFVFAFDITTVPGELHQLLEWQGTRLLKTCSLKMLNADLNQKKALWLSLKQAFKI